MNNKLVLTGANGFLGRNTIKIAQQSWNVTGIIRRPKVLQQITDSGAIPYVLPDFSVNELASVFKGAQAVINFLGIVSGSAEQFQKINVDNFEKVVKAAELAKVERVICISGLGIEEYGKEEWASNNYFKSKLQMENILKNSTVPYTIFRPSYILGAKDELIPDLIKQFKTGEVTIIGPGTIPMQPIFVHDAVQAFLYAAAGNGPDNETYDLVGPEIITMNGLVEKVRNFIATRTTLPPTTYKHLSIDEAETLLNFPREVADIFLCDSLGNPNVIVSQLGIHLTPLDETLTQALSTNLVNVE